MTQALTATSPIYAYVGSRTTRERNARGDGITVYRFDSHTGALNLLQSLDGLINPSFLALNTRQDRLYTVHGDGHQLSVFKISAQDGRLEFMQTQDCGGRNPVHLALSPDDSFMVVSDHLGSSGGGSLAVMPIGDDGSLAPVCQRIPLIGEPGPHRKEQPFAKPHFNPFDPSGKFVVVPDKGLDKIFVFRFDAQRSMSEPLQPATIPFVSTREGAGPRHLAFHPGRPYAYCVNELDSTVTAYRFDAGTGGLEPLQILSSLPERFTGNSRAAEIEVSADGRALYASNRGHDSIAVFRIALNTGLLRFIEATNCEGKTPRFFSIAPNGRYLLTLNEDSDDIKTFAIEPTFGKLRATAHSVTAGSPVCLVWGTKSCSSMVMHPY
jgi:6-phosphogluconolactonase